MARTELPNGVILPAEYSDDWYEDMTSNLTKLDDVIGSNAEKLSEGDVSRVAMTGDYSDIDNTPDLSPYNTHIADANIHVTAADKQKWNDNVNQSYVLRYASTSVTPSSTIAYSVLNNTDNIKIGDSVIDSSGKVFLIVSVDSVNETVTVGAVLLTLALDSNVVHTSGDETITGTKTFGNGTLIVDNGVGSNVHGEIKFSGSRIGYIVADNSADGVFNSAGSGISILFQDAEKPLHVGGYTVASNGRVFADNTNKKPILSITSSLIQTSTLVPENDSTGALFRILSRLDYANGDASKTLDVRFQQNDDADATSVIYSNVNNKTSLGTASKKWKDFQTYLINGLTPSSLSLPTDNMANIIDISGYLTVLDGSSANTYQAPDNGYISITMNNCSGIQAYITGFWGNQIVRPSSGGVRFFMPICKNMTANILIFGGTVDNARFFPCQGNI